MWWTKPLGRTAAFAILLAASGCANAPKGPVGPQAITPTEQFTPHVERAPEQLALSVHPQGLSGPQSAAIADFASRWRAQGGGEIQVRAPDGPGADQALITVSNVRSALESLGVPAIAIRQDHYAPGGGTPGPVLLSFERLDVSLPDCAHHWDNLTSTLENRPYATFGCAVTANMAAQIADPRDLVAPTPLAPGDNLRREIVLGKYREGKVTASDRDVQASGSVSTAVQQ